MSRLSLGGKQEEQMKYQLCAEDEKGDNVGEEAAECQCSFTQSRVVHTRVCIQENQTIV